MDKSSSRICTSNQTYTMKPITISILLFLVSANISAQNRSGMDYAKERFERIKKITVRIFIDTIPVGSGFFVYDKSHIATCFHVIRNSNDNIYVELNDGAKYKASLSKYILTNKLLEAEAYDYFILNVEIGQKSIPIIPLGTYSDCAEGALIYLCGYPFGIPNPIVSVGYLSSKWIDTIKFQVAGKTKNTYNRNVSWLDITMTSGNSGGPVLVLGKKPENDRIIGIASFNLNPYSTIADSIYKEVLDFPEGLQIGGLDISKFSRLSYQSIKTSTVGVGGCTSIEYIKAVASQ